MLYYRAPQDSIRCIVTMLTDDGASEESAGGETLFQDLTSGSNDNEAGTLSTICAPLQRRYWSGHQPLFLFGCSSTSFDDALKRCTAGSDWV